MVKRKSLPKPRIEAGFAARTEQPVHDTTISEDTDDSNNSTESNHPQPQKATTSKAATSQPVAKTKNKFEKTLFKTKSKTGTVALKEIKRLQTSTKLIIPRAPFLRVVKEILHSRATTDFRVTEMAVEALREASENILTSIFEDSYLVATHAKRVTLFPRDMALVLNLRRDALSGTITPN